MLRLLEIDCHVVEGLVHLSTSEKGRELRQDAIELIEVSELSFGFDFS